MIAFLLFACVCFLRVDWCYLISFSIQHEFTVGCYQVVLTPNLSGKHEKVLVVVVLTDLFLTARHGRFLQLAFLNICVVLCIEIFIQCSDLVSGENCVYIETFAIIYFLFVCMHQPPRMKCGR